MSASVSISKAARVTTNGVTQRHQQPIYILIPITKIFPPLLRLQRKPMRAESPARVSPLLSPTTAQCKKRACISITSAQCPSYRDPGQDTANSVTAPRDIVTLCHGRGGYCAVSIPQPRQFRVARDLGPVSRSPGPQLQQTAVGYLLLLLLLLLLVVMQLSADRYLAPAQQRAGPGPGYENIHPCRRQAPECRYCVDMCRYV